MANQVQDDFKCSNFGVSIKDLEKRFLNGSVLSLKDIRNKAIGSRRCRLMTDYKWEK
jgi:hypothetical protein